jgi:hypothetical protein
MYGKLADELCRYLHYRAKIVGVDCDWTPEVIEAQLRKGTTVFGNLHVADGEIVDDKQRPDILKRWRTN